MKIMDEKRIALSVTELVRFAAGAGNIDARYGGDATGALSKGAAVHRRLQRESGGLYLPEVALSGSVSLDGIEYLLSGRADGIIDTPEGSVTVDEIKSTRLSPALLSPAVHEMYFAQGEVYAFLYSVIHRLDRMAVRLTYYHTETDKIYRTVREYSASELKERVILLLRKAAAAVTAVCERKLILPGELADAPFPYDNKREGQKETVLRAYSVFRQGGRIFAEAPTGIGKTISALYPALKAVGTGHADKVFYLTAKGVIARQAAATAEKMGAEHLRTVILSARSKMCISDVKPSPSHTAETCNPDVCCGAKGHYERSREALDELLGMRGVYTPELITRVAVKYKVCPYELSLDLSEFCTVVICDYNYLFSPRVKLRRYFSDNGAERTDPSERFIFLIDEAHNLLSRARDMYSASLSSIEADGFGEIGGVAGEAALQLASALRGCTSYISESEENELDDGSLGMCGATVIPSPPEAVTEAAESFCRGVTARKAVGAVISPELTEFYYKVNAYLDRAKNSDDRYAAYLEMRGEELELRLICLDPSADISRCLDTGQGAMFFSATLSPIDYYINVLSGPDSAESLVLESPFPTENFSVFIGDRFSTRYSDREKSLTALSDMIAAAAGAKKGNYIVFFPSYGYMNSVYERFKKRYPTVNAIVQERNSGEKKRREFIASFADDGERRVFFCVLGGIYSEGIDLTGDKLIGAIIVGVGIGQMSNERNVLAEYYEKKYEAGYDYAYTYPGINRVLQAAGRVIRSETDRGIIVLLDDRYADGKYMELFPASWKGNIRFVGDAPSLREAAKRFWADEQ